MVEIIDHTNIFNLFKIINNNNNNYDLDFKIIYFNNKYIYKLYGSNYLIKYNLNNNIELPNLVLLSGFSNKSIINSSKIILKNINKIKDKYQSFYIFAYDEKIFKKFQKDACDIRDEQKIIHKSFNKIYNSEIKLN